VCIYLALLEKKGTRERFLSPSFVVPFDCPAIASPLSLSLPPSLPLSLSLIQNGRQSITQAYLALMPPPLIRNTINYPPQITRSRYMEQQPLPLLVSSSKSTAASSPPTEVPTPPPAASDYSRPCNNEGGSEIIKAKIMSHPLYPALLRSFIDCRKVRTNSISHRNTIWV
jgi:hypothetical protein